MFRNWCLIAAFLGVISFGASEPSIEFQTRYHDETNHLNTLDFGVLGDFPLHDRITLSPALFLGASRKDFESFSYKGELKFAALPFFQVGTRFSQDYHLSHTFALAHILFFAELYAEPWEKFHFGITGAWYKRYGQLSETTMVFFPFLNSYSEHDFGAKISLTTPLFERWAFALDISTFDAISVFNLNHPFAEARLFHPLETAAFHGSEVSAFFRYQILLGFGRLEEAMAGVSFSWKLYQN